MEEAKEQPAPSFSREYWAALLLSDPPRERQRLGGTCLQVGLSTVTDSSTVMRPQRGVLWIPVIGLVVGRVCVGVCVPRFAILVPA